MRTVKILFLATEDWCFRSHRLPLARAMRSQGAEVYLMTNVGRFGDSLKSEGFRVIPWSTSRNSLNPLQQLRALWKVILIYRRIRPDIVHHVAMKPVIFGGCVAKFMNVSVVNAIAGLGTGFALKGLENKLLRLLLMPLLRMSLNQRNSRTIFQTSNDLEALVRAKILLREKAVLIPGVGVNLSDFCPLPEPEGVPVVLFTSRLIWAKGLGDLIEAIKIIRSKQIPARFLVVGSPDDESSSSIPMSQLEEWSAAGLIEYKTRQDNMPEIFAACGIFCFPTFYNEGIPKVLLEAAASGRAIITTDIPGCVQVVKDGQNGIIVPARDVRALADAIVRLVQNSELRQKMGRIGREIAVREFSEERSTQATLDIYSDLLGRETILEKMTSAGNA